MRFSVKPALRGALMLLISLILLAGPFPALPHQILGGPNVALAGPPPYPTTSTPAPTATPPPGCEAVAWTNLVNTTATGNSIQKTGGVSSTWDAGASSTRAIQSGNGYAQVTVDERGTYKLFGLSNGDANPSTTDVDFALF